MMGHGERDELDAIFEALANKHRREIIKVLGQHPCSISQLAEMRALSLPAIHKHITILEDTGLVLRRKIGRTNFLTLNPRSLLGPQNWLARFHTYWGYERQTLENYARYLGAELTDGNDKP